MVPLGAQSGWEAAVYDHFHAMVKTVICKLRQDAEGASSGDRVGGSTYSFAVWDGHPLATRVHAQLSQFRKATTALREARGPQLLLDPRQRRRGGVQDLQRLLRAARHPVVRGRCRGHGKERLTGWCTLVGEVPAMSFLGQAINLCSQVAMTAASTFDKIELDPTAICDPGFDAKMRGCSDALNPCPQPPLCVGAGTWGCDDMVAACPALSDKACRAGFDSRTHESRVRIHACVAAASGNCVDTFYRCAWGL